jgi:hypothetical protein
MFVPVLKALPFDVNDTPGGRSGCWARTRAGVDSTKATATHSQPAGLFINRFIINMTVGAILAHVKMDLTDKAKSCLISVLLRMKANLTIQKSHRAPRYNGLMSVWQRGCTWPGSAGGTS